MLGLRDLWQAGQFLVSLRNLTTLGTMDTFYSVGCCFLRVAGEFKDESELCTCI